MKNNIEIKISGNVGYDGAYYWIDEEDGTGECQVNLDEDDLARMLSGSADSCPYFQMYDEYKIVRKQI